MPCLPVKYVDDEAGELCNRQQRRVQNLKLRRKYGAYMWKLILLISAYAKHTHTWCVDKSLTCSAILTAWKWHAECRLSLLSDNFRAPAGREMPLFTLLTATPGKSCTSGGNRTWLKWKYSLDWIGPYSSLCTLNLEQRSSTADIHLANQEISHLLWKA